MPNRWMAARPGQRKEPPVGQVHGKTQSLCRAGRHCDRRATHVNCSNLGQPSPALTIAAIIAFSWGPAVVGLEQKSQRNQMCGSRSVLVARLRRGIAVKIAAGLLVLGSAGAAFAADIPDAAPPARE